MLLVGVEFRSRRKGVLAQAAMARDSVVGDGSADQNQTQNKDITVAPPSAGERSSAAGDAMEEFRELATSAGAEIVGELEQRRDRPDPATLIGKGKLQEIAGAAASARAEVILFDHDLSPSQQRNIEREIASARVIDRTQLILDIFARHARTREGQLQVELAQLEYMLPRLGGRGIEMSQLGGGIGTRGPGETQLETDRRKIHRRIRHIREQLEEVRRIRAQQRSRRQSVPVPTVALVGYTNAGKSTLFNALTQAEVVASPRMFATLDPTLRTVVLPSRRKALLSDTVGFIRDLPHTLVTSFRATLEEVQRASLVVHVSDISSPMQQEQRVQVNEVLKELEVLGKPTIQVMNKIDLLPPEKRAQLQNSGETVYVSAIKGIGLSELLARIDVLLQEDALYSAKLKIPQSEGKALALVDAGAVVSARSYRGGNVHLQVQAPQSLLRRINRFVLSEEPLHTHGPKI